MGNSIFAGVSILLVAAPVSFAIGILQRKIRVKTMKIKDERIKLLKEVLSSIKVCVCGSYSMSMCFLYQCALYVSVHATMIY